MVPMVTLRAEPGDTCGMPDSRATASDTESTADRPPTAGSCTLTGGDALNDRAFISLRSASKLKGPDLLSASAL